MIRSRFLRVSRAVLLGSTVLAAAVFADNAPSAPAAPVIRVSAGTIVGLVTNSAKLPIAGATVTAARVDGNGIRATVSSSDGIYSFADLAPGAWSVTVQIDGYPDVVVPSLEVAGSKATRHDIVMNMPAVLPSAPALADRGGVSTDRPVVAAVRLHNRLPVAAPIRGRERGEPIGQALHGAGSVRPRRPAPTMFMVCLLLKVF